MGTVRYTVIDGEVIAENRNGVRSFYVPDPLGSTVALIDNTATVTDTFSYWPYGEILNRTGSTPTPFQYVGTLGYYNDSASKTYVRARTLDTPKARWLTEDPAGSSGRDGYPYAYVGGMPTARRDPSGLQSVGVPCKEPRLGMCKAICHNQHKNFGWCMEAAPWDQEYNSANNPFTCHCHPKVEAWHYGKCCGLNRRSDCNGDKPTTKGRDCIDNACCQHDCCLGTFDDWCRRGQWCDDQLCKAAARCLAKGCNSAPDPGECRMAARQIKLWACSIGTGSMVKSLIV